MTKQKKILISIVLLILILSIFSNIASLTPEEKNFQKYTQALEQYNGGEFQNSYFIFSKISKHSKLKPAAIYRQALCAERLGDSKTEIKKYKELMRNYPNSNLAIRAKYLRAQSFYASKEAKKAKKEFRDILKNYPKTDYAIASRYYLGLIEADKIPDIKSEKKKLKATKKAIHYFRAYLKEAPKGRFAIYSAQKWVSLSDNLTNEDNLIIAKIYLENEDYKNAQKYLKLTNISVSWPYFVKNAYALKNYSMARVYTEQGLRGKGADAVLINEAFNEKEENENIYEAIDIYLKISNSPRAAISYLMSIAGKSKGYDYLLYKNCNNMPASNQSACFNTLYYKYPHGQFAADALANIFYSKVRSEDYYVAKKVGKKHLSEFLNSNSAPKVMFWLAKIAERTKNYEEARWYYKTLLRTFPDDYYAYHSFLNLNRFRHPSFGDLEIRNIEFPYRNSGTDLIVKLAEVKDYGLINLLCKDDEFVQSWLAYKKGDFSNSARIARDAMEKVSSKPDRGDLRWRLVYPIHYYDVIKDNALDWNNDPVIILSIIREESYFNPEIRSVVGASGLMQLMPGTAREAANMAGISFIGENMLFDPEINIKLGNIYYSRLRRTLANKDILAVLAYNGGIGSVSRWSESLDYVDVDDFVEQIPYPETQNYLKKVYRSYWNYLRVYGGVRF